MDLNKKILGINLIIMLLYALIIHLAYFSDTGPYGGGFAILIIQMIVGGIHCGGLLLISIGLLIYGNKKKSLNYFLSSIITGAVGFGTCWGSSMLADGY